MKKKLCFVIFTYLFFCLAIFSCQMFIDAPVKQQKILSGSISGRVQFAIDDFRAGIIVELEKTDGKVSLAAISAARNIANGANPDTVINSACRSIGSTVDSIVATTVTDNNGYYKFPKIQPGTYTIYASSPDSPEKAVLTNITIVPGASFIAPLMTITDVGFIRGRIIVDNKLIGNYGFLVCVEGTSFMAITANDGTYTIYNVPFNDSNQESFNLIIIKGTYMDYWPLNTPLIVDDEFNASIPDPNPLYLESEVIYANPVRVMIEKLIKNEKIRIGAGAGLYSHLPLELKLAGAGIDLFNDISMKILFDTIKDYYVHLDFTNVQGNAFTAYPLSASIDKSKILSVTFGENVKKISGGTSETDPAIAFLNFTGLEHIYAPGITRLEAYTFNDSNLNSIDFPAVTIIENNAISNFVTLSSVKLRSYRSIPDIQNDWRFLNHITLGLIHLDSSNQLCSWSQTSVEFPDATSIASNYFDGLMITSLKCPKVTNISMLVNSGIDLNKLEHLTLGLNGINSVAFRYCNKLISVSFPNAQYISYGGFDGCTSLSEVNFPQLESIYSGAFQNCISLESVEFPELFDIGTGAFYGCSNLTSIILPKYDNPDFYDYLPIDQLEHLTLGLEDIPDNAFNTCSNLISVNFPKATSIGFSAFNGFHGCTNLKEVNIPLAESIGDWAFYRTSLEEAYFPLAENIGWAVFAECYNLESVYMPLVESIGGWALSNTNIANAYFPAVIDIDEYAFILCKNLETVHFPLAKNIGEGAFNQCINLLDANFPCVTSIGNWAFATCTSLENINFPKVISIADWNFVECFNLELAYIPVVNYIGEGTFYNCNILSNITLGTNAPVLGGDVFKGSTPASFTIKVPNSPSVISAYNTWKSTNSSNFNNYMSVTIAPWN